MIESQVITFGCRLNSFETGIIEQNLLSVHQSGVLVFNTCAVTLEAQKEAQAAIKKAKSRNPDAKIIVTGCAAQYNPEFFACMPEVDKVIGNEEKLDKSNYLLDDDKRVMVQNIADVDKLREIQVHKSRKTRAFLQIQNGCNHRCTFCMIPLARGNSRSLPIGKIVQDIVELVGYGHKEVVFTGVDITDYGLDLPNKPSLAQMIKRVLALVPQLPRLRLSSIDVAEVDSELFDLMAKEPRLMPHYHISMQSGDPMILKRMKRRHNPAQVVEFCNELRKIRPEVAFGADIITGFPTESEEMFLNTMRTVEQAGMQFLHVFPYSPRSDTPAARMPQVHSETRKERARRLIAFGKQELYNFLLRNLEVVHDVLVENGNKGHAENFIKVRFRGEVESNKIVKARIKGVLGEDVIGEVI